MVRKSTRLLLCIALLLCMLVACGKKENDNTNKTEATVTMDSSSDLVLTPGLYLQVEDLPSIDTFSSSGLEQRINQFPKIVSVRYYAQGTFTELPINEKRVFQLLNFLSRSFDDGNYGMQYGYEEANCIAQWYASLDPMLEVTFERPDDLQPMKGNADCSKLLVRGGVVLEVLDPRFFEDGLEKGVLLWPYNTLLKEQASKYLCFPEKEQWIDLLVYAGFNGEELG